MGKRSAFVQPKVVRLQLADVRRRALETLQKQTLPKPATEAALDAARFALEEAEEDGYYIDVKGELNAGESRRLFTDLVREGGFVAGDKPIIDPQQLGISKVIQYLVGWNMTDEKGQSVPVSEAAVNNLRKDVYDDIVAAVDWHEDKVEAERTARKNGPDTVRESPVTSGLPSAVTGVSSGSES